MVIPLRAYLGLLAFIALERIFELALSRRNARRAFARGGIESGQRHYRVMTVLHTSFLLSCAVEAMLTDRAAPAWLSMSALTGALAAQALRYWAVSALGDRWNTRVIVLPGAAPVTRGPYRFMRHPNYLAVMLELASVPLIRGLWITAAVFSVANAILLAVRITVEERALGDRYASSFAALPRLIPRLRHG